MTTNYMGKIYKWKLGKNKLNGVKKGNLYDYGLHVYKSLKKVSIGRFYPRIFKCTIGEIYCEDSIKVRTDEVTLIEELEPSMVEDSKWAYYYCGYIKDIKEIRDKITDSKMAFWYCYYIKDRKEIRDRITDSRWAYEYCLKVKDRKEVRDRITESYLADYYCRYIKGRKPRTKCKK